jgi:glycosyltransferase involved in cell wall biosynthesis
VVNHAVKDSRAIITVSEYSKQRMIERFHVPSDKVTVTYESVDPLPEAVPFQTLAEHGVNQPYLLHVGNTYPHKNLNRFISAVKMVQRKNADFQVVLVGKDDYFSQRLRQEVAKLEVRNILFYGFAADQELAALYQHAQAYFFPSLSEGFGLPGLEAMQAGTPVYAANVSCLPEVFGKAAAYFNPLDVAAIAQSIEQALHDTMKRQTLIAAGRQQLLKYSWRRMAQETLKVYEQTVNHANPKNITT